MPKVLQMESDSKQSRNQPSGKKRERGGDESADRLRKIAVRADDMKLSISDALTVVSVAQCKYADDECGFSGVLDLIEFELLAIQNDHEHITALAPYTGP